jgi:predicted transcriptional regulator
LATSLNHPIFKIMTELLEHAIKTIRNQPEAVQDQIADNILQMIADAELPEEIDPEHLEGVLEGLAQADRGEFVPEEEMQAFFARYKL